MDTERVLSGQTVLVQNGWITMFGPASQVPVPAGAMRIDGRGKYLLPGLADMHAHLFMLAQNAYNVTDSAAAERRLFAWLAEGVTTIRNLDYVPVGHAGVRLESAFTLRLRARAAAGSLLSPRIYTSGPWAPNQYIGQYRQELGKPEKQAPALALDSVAAYVTAYKTAGYDFVKIHQEPAIVAESLLVVARRVGIPTLGHVRLGIERTLTSGAYASIEHLRGYVRTPLHPDSAATFDASRIRALATATRRAGTWNVPTMALEEWQRGKEDLAVRRRLVKALQDVGAGLLLGTDAPAGRIPPGAGVHQELAALVRAELTPYQALLAGTRNVAEYFGTLDSTGTVAVGKRADLVLLNVNPLENIQNTAQPAGVMIGGRWLSRAEINQRLVAVKAAAVPSP